MQDTTKRPKGKCAYCGKEITIDSVRNAKVIYCCRACASMARYQKRYVGPRSGRGDMPTWDRRKFKRS